MWFGVCSSFALLMVCGYCSNLFGFDLVLFCVILLFWLFVALLIGWLFDSVGCCLFNSVVVLGLRCSDYSLFALVV